MIYLARKSRNVRERERAWPHRNSPQRPIENFEVRFQAVYKRYLRLLPISLSLSFSFFDKTLKESFFFFLSCGNPSRAKLGLFLSLAMRRGYVKMEQEAARRARGGGSHGRRKQKEQGRRDGGRKLIGIKTLNIYN